MAGRKKRCLDEVVDQPEFVVEEEDGGAYNVVEMPKRFVHGYIANKGRIRSERMRAFEADITTKEHYSGGLKTTIAAG